MIAGMDRFTLNDLGKLTGIKSETIRIWETRYGILKPGRTATNRRLYSDNDLIHLLNISVLYRNNIKISAIARLSAAEVAEKASALYSNPGEPDTAIGALLVAMTRFDETSVDEILLQSVINLGFRKTFESVIFPFLVKIGQMWHTGSVNVGAEHFMTSVFRQRLIAATDMIPPASGKNARRVIMFLPEGELHELGLLYYRYIIRERGHHVLYLGQSTPFNTLPAVCEIWKPDFMVTGIQSGLTYDTSGEYLKMLAGTFPNIKILVGGLLATHSQLKGYRNVFPLYSPSGLERFF